MNQNHFSYLIGWGRLTSPWCRSFRQVRERTTGFQGSGTCTCPTCLRGGGGGGGGGDTWLRRNSSCNSQSLFNGVRDREWGREREPEREPEMSEPSTNPAATSFPSPIISLPMGAGVLKTVTGALVCLEIVSIRSEFDHIAGSVVRCQWPPLSLLIINEQ